MSEERLQKILARAGIASRRKAEELIARGAGHRQRPGGRAGRQGGPRARRHQGRRQAGPAAAGEHRYLLLNKPKGVMSTVSDPEGRPTVIDLVPPAHAQGAGAGRPARLPDRGAAAAHRRRRVRPAHRPSPLRLHQDLRGQGQGDARRGASSTACAAAS